MAASKAKSWHTTKLTCKEKLKFHISNIDLNFSFDVTFKFSGQKHYIKLRSSNIQKKQKTKIRGLPRDDSLKFKVMGRYTLSVLHLAMTGGTQCGEKAYRGTWKNLETQGSDIEMESIGGYPVV